MWVLSRLLVGWCILLLSTQVFARAAEPTAGNPFVGLNFASAEAEFDGLPDDQSRGFGFKLGVGYPASRLYASLDFYSWEEAESLVISAHYDRLLRVHPYLTLFLGVNASLTDFEIDGRYDPKDFDTGPGVGAQAGILIPLSRSWQLEAGVRSDRFWVDAEVRAEDQPLDKLGFEAMSLGYVSLVFTSLGPGG